MLHGMVGELSRRGPLGFMRHPDEWPGVDGPTPPQPPTPPARRVDNDSFFARASWQHAPRSVPEWAFYARARPEPEVGLATRTALTPRRFALVLFLVGWTGILFQASFLQQVVFGAPVFEELAKFGLALLVAALLGAQALWARLPLAWASGAGFGVLEHYTTYPEEPALGFASRIVFHAAATGLSMLSYHAFERMPDVRARWASTAAATLFHWANNFGAVVFGVASLVVHDAEAGAFLWSYGVTAALLALTLVALAWRGRFEGAARELLASAVPRLGLPPLARPAAALPPPPPPEEGPAPPP